MGPADPPKMDHQQTEREQQMLSVVESPCTTPAAVPMCRGISNEGFQLSSELNSVAEDLRGISNMLGHSRRSELRHTDRHTALQVHLCKASLPIGGMSPMLPSQPVAAPSATMPVGDNEAEHLATRPRDEVKDFESSTVLEQQLALQQRAARANQHYPPCFRHAQRRAACEGESFLDFVMLRRNEDRADKALASNVSGASGIACSSNFAEALPLEDDTMVSTSVALSEAGLSEASPDYFDPATLTEHGSGGRSQANQAQTNYARESMAQRESPSPIQYQPQPTMTQHFLQSHPSSSSGQQWQRAQPEHTTASAFIASPPPRKSSHGSPNGPISPSVARRRNSRAAFAGCTSGIAAVYSRGVAGGSNIGQHCHRHD